MTPDRKIQTSRQTTMLECHAVTCGRSWRWKLSLQAAIVGFALVASSSVALADKLTVDFGFFPKGLDCDVGGTSGKVSVRRGRELEYTIKGDVAGTKFACTLPDGRSFTVAPGVWYVAGTRMTAVQINADDRAIIMWDSGGGLSQSTQSGVLNWN